MWGQRGTLEVAHERVVLRGDGGRRTQHLHRLARHTPAHELGAQSIVASARLLSRRNPPLSASSASGELLVRPMASYSATIPHRTACALTDALWSVILVEGRTGDERSPERPTRHPRPPPRRSRWASPGTGARSPQCAPPPAAATPPRPASVPAPECREAATGGDQHDEVLGRG